MRLPSSIRTSVRFRARRLLVPTLAAASLVLGLDAVATPAAATPEAPSVRVVSGNRTVTAAWAKVDGATDYLVRYGTTKARTSSTVVDGGSVKLTGLTNGKRYYLSVTARGAGTSTSSVLTAAPAAGYPAEMAKPSAESATGDRIVVTLPKVGRATKVAVVAGANPSLTKHTFSTRWVRATTRTITVTVPTSLRHHLGAGTGNPVFVKVVASNTTAPGGTKYLSSDGAKAYRMSPSGAWAIAGGAAPTVSAADVSKLDVAAINTQGWTATKDYSADNRWAARKARNEKTIEASGADLVLTAELQLQKIDQSCSNRSTSGFYCKTQAEDLADELADTYEWATSDTYPQVLAYTREHEDWAGEVTQGTQIFYKRDRMELLDHGYLAPAAPASRLFGDVQGLGVAGWTPSRIGNDRWLSWAEFRLKDGSDREFLAVAVHFPAGQTDPLVALRADEAAKVAEWAKRKAAGRPVVLGGDLNADPFRAANPNPRVLLKAGFYDAASTANRHGIRWSTFNSHNGTGGADWGYPSRAVPAPGPSSRIDYILTLNSPYTYRYQNVVHVKDGRFVRAYQGSDHNLQLATVGLTG